MFKFLIVVFFLLALSLVVRLLVSAISSMAHDDCDEGNKGGPKSEERGGRGQNDDFDAIGLVRPLLDMQTPQRDTGYDLARASVDRHACSLRPMSPASLDISNSLAQERLRRRRCDDQSRAKIGSERDADRCI